MKLYAALTVLTLLVTAVFWTVGDFPSPLAAAGWAAQMLLLFAAGDLAAVALRRRRFALAAVAAAVAAVIVGHRLGEATQPAYTVVGLALIVGGAVTLSLVLRDTQPSKPTNATLGR